MSYLRQLLNSVFFKKQQEIDSSKKSVTIDIGDIPTVNGPLGDFDTEITYAVMEITDKDDRRTRVIRFGHHSVNPKSISLRFAAEMKGAFGVEYLGGGCCEEYLALNAMGERASGNCTWI